MKVEFAAPFLSSAITIINQTAGVIGYKKDLSIKPSPVTGGEVSIYIGVNGMVTGQVVYCMSIDCGIALASSMVDQKLSSLNELAKSALSELANMITGNASIGLAANGYQSAITPPMTFVGNDLSISTSMPILCIPIDLSIGYTMVINIALKEKCV